ncbi:MULTISPECIES: helix-turn-helix domain-containing protein [Agrobacterium]|jgi:DNA-binding transcriptional regulator YiaG|uniref:helix-turn-helix domain-containing protein n=1 Tax=Agrobacterium TaxID=357 RepID=UPI001B8A132D|nr:MULTISPECIES: helix-turn-helix domain-containing protein [Agrobacterium]MCZ7927345.1 helix-turn-helix domain-containing protein [Agrobacterium pusense]MDP9772642.1 DNA-binding transcriptional regulator YiaG [Rhizobium sp. SORGH_AS_0755]WHO24286.1 helix-turn-helix domain-containing protein [Agrobacterium tumefaciens]
MNEIRHIRKTLFAVSQSDFAAILGVAQSTVSRWEGGVAPSLEEMRAIRSAAFEREIVWNDSYFFQIPKEAAE